MELLFSVAASHLVGFVAMRNFISEAEFRSSLSLSESELSWSVLVFLQLSRRLVQGALQPKTKLELNPKKSCLFSTDFRELMYLKMNHSFDTVSFRLMAWPDAGVLVHVVKRGREKGWIGNLCPQTWTMSVISFVHFLKHIIDVTFCVHSRS